MTNEKMFYLAFGAIALYYISRPTNNMDSSHTLGFFGTRM